MDELIDGDGLDADIPKRMMRVKILYSFDDQNKTNCLARIPSALSIPTVSVDESTQIGVIELKTCIQAIVQASPELIAKLENDYTVYAYDYSEYETPLVGQGMLSRLLASASPTPAAPAAQSSTMITGRVCKNILGLFTNGVKETLEVKLKLVAVPSCVQTEYQEKMESYRSLSRTGPGSPDPTSWNPPQPNRPGIQRSDTGGVESLHDLLTQGMPPMDNRDYAMSGMEGSARGSRAGSPAASVRSASGYRQMSQNPPSRPESRMSVRSENPHIRRFSVDAGEGEQEIDDGPSRKRARLSKADWRGKSSFGARPESLRVTASTTASIRNHRLLPSESFNGEPSDPLQRPPTPRPHHTARQIREQRSNPSMLRHGSTAGQNEPYQSPYSDGYDLPGRHDSTLYSEGSYGSPSPDFPSSPPELLNHDDQRAPPSSPLPSQSFQTDSGFQSDAIVDQELDPQVLARLKQYQGIVRRNSQAAWREEQPGPPELLPTTFPLANTQAYKRAIPGSVLYQDPASFYMSAPSSPLLRPRPRTTSMANRLEIAPRPPISDFQELVPRVDAEIPLPTSEQSPAADLDQSDAAPPVVQAPSSNSQFSLSLPPPPTTTRTIISILGSARASAEPSKVTRLRKSRKITRTQTWSGDVPTSDIFSEGLSEPGSDYGRNRPVRPKTGDGGATGSSVRVREAIIQKAANAVKNGLMPDYCRNCGEINTPTWRKVYTRVEEGSPSHIHLSKESKKQKGAIVSYETTKASENGDVLEYRIYKKSLGPNEKIASEKTDDGYEEVLLCNPCGLWFNNKGTMKPPPDANLQPKKQRKPRPRKISDGVDVPSSDFPDQPPPTEKIIECDPLGAVVVGKVLQEYREESNPLLDTSKQRATSLEPSHLDKKRGGQLDNTHSVAALHRAIQSSPARVVGSAHSPIEIEPDLTPKPTRRQLFPSPRLDGRPKSLSDELIVTKATTTQPFAPPPKPSVAAQILPQNKDNADQTDKENHPPAVDEDDDEFAHLFEGSIAGTPRSASKSASSTILQLPKTPKTPSSSKSKRSALTPHSSNSKRSRLNAETPSRSSRNINNNPHGTMNPPMTPFTAEMNRILSDSSAFNDPGMLPNFMSPPRATDTMDFSTIGHLNFGMGMGMGMDNFFSTDLPFPSSPPANPFALYEDPETATQQLWNGPNIFTTFNEGGDELNLADGDDGDQGTQGGVDFSAIVAELIGCGGVSDPAAEDE